MTKLLDEVNFEKHDIQAAYEKSLLPDCDIEYLLERLNCNLPLYQRLNQAHLKILVELIIKSTDPRLRYFG